MYKYDFETVVDRSNAGSFKWTSMINKGITGVVPLSVADMELKNAPEIIEGLKDYLDKTILGYTGPTDSYWDSVINWVKKQHNATVTKEDITITQGVVAAIDLAVKAFTKENDGIIIFNPVYYPFGMTINKNNRKLVNVPLLEKEDNFTPDFEAFEKACKDPDNKMLIFCSPHNPIGRIWSREELVKIHQIALENDVIIVSDEIWWDFYYSEQKRHVSALELDEKYALNTIVCTSPSKTFNLAGMRISNIFIKDHAKKEIYDQVASTYNQGQAHMLSYKAVELTYNESYDWYQECLKLIHDNYLTIKKWFEEKYPKITVCELTGTYLLWIDFRCLGLNNEDLEAMMLKAKIVTDEGYLFGEEGSGYERINLACPKHVITDTLDRLDEVLKDYYK
ncbi:MAG: PatB family C-S lyase [Erysipelotrichaceae bacterium]|nr:PatB family C-S lyase [Erysipelotrichaceae bacterium]